MFCFLTFNKIVGDPGAKALHGMYGLSVLTDFYDFERNFKGELWQRPAL